MDVVLLTGDLTVISRVEGAARLAGMKVRTAAGAGSAVECCAAEPVKFLIIDLSTRSLNVKALVDQLPTSATHRPHVIAFGPHVHEERLAAARDAGCDTVLSRGQFFAQVDGLVDL
jgi:DNA-binding response OmpR family regulator